MIWNALALDGHWKAPEANRLFYIEDEKLAATLENIENGLKRERAKLNRRDPGDPDDKLIQETVLQNLPLFQMLATNNKQRSTKK